MTEINFALLNPVDVGALTQQGFATGMAMVKHVQTQNALKAYLANPDDTQAYNALAAFDPNAAATIQQQQVLRRKELRETQDRERAVSLGELATTDPAGAKEEALKAGDFDLADHFSKLDDNERTRTIKGFEAAAPIAFKLRQIKDPAQRQALLQQARPQLEAAGFPPDKLDQFDVTNDTALDAIIASGQKVSDLIDQGKVVWHQQGEQPSFATDSMGRPIGSMNPYAKGSAASLTPSASAAASTLSASLPPSVVAGFLGNFHVEGGYGGAKGDGGSAAGIAQWRGERAANFEKVIGKPVAQASPDEQAKFVLWEMQNPEAAGMTAQQRDAILAARSPAEAADLIDRFYERSSGEHRERRKEAATRLAGAGMSEGDIRAKAADAIAKGADPAAVKARAKSMGVNL